MTEPAFTVRELVLDHDRRLDTLDAWRAELRGAFRLMQLAFGTSIVSAIVSIIGIVAVISGRQ